MIKENISWEARLQNEEKKNTYVRQMSWNGSTNYGVDIRQKYLQDDVEKNGKGIFLTQNGAIEMVEVLVENGYGRTDVLQETLSNRTNEIPLVTDDIEVELDDDTTYINLEDALGEI